MLDREHGGELVQKLLQHNAFAGDFLADPCGFLAVKHDTQEHKDMEALLEDDIVEVICQGCEYTTCRFSRDGLQHLQVVSKVQKCKWTLHADSIDEKIARTEWTSWELMVALHRDGWCINVLPRQKRRKGLLPFQGGAKVLYLRSRTGGCRGLANNGPDNRG